MFNNICLGKIVFVKPLCIFRKEGLQWLEHLITKTEPGDFITGL